MEWPIPPQVLTQFISYLQVIHGRWRASIILRRIPIEDRPEVQLKCVACEVLEQRRPDWGLQRKWFGNYLAMPEENRRTGLFQTSLSHLQRSHDFERVLFSCEVMKVNKRGRVQHRAILISDNHLFKLDPNKGYQRKKSPIPFQDIQGFGISPQKDQGFIVHLRGGSDIICYMLCPNQEDRVSELCAVLFQICRRKCGNTLRVNVTNPLPFSVSGKYKQLFCQEDKVPRPLIKKNGGNGFILFWPVSAY